MHTSFVNACKCRVAMQILRCVPRDLLAATPQSQLTELGYSEPQFLGVTRPPPPVFFIRHHVELISATMIPGWFK